MVGLSLQRGGSRFFQKTIVEWNIYMTESEPEEAAKLQEKKEFSTLFTLSIVYAIGAIGVVVAAVMVTSQIMN